MKNRTATLVSILLSVVIVAIVALIVVSASAPASGLPAYATVHPKIKEAYEFAVSNPEALDGVNCYCGCMQHPHDGRIHKRGLLDCFKNGNAFDSHASQCDMCINDALEVKRMFEQGLPKEEIKNKTDSKYQ